MKYIPLTKGKLTIVDDEDFNLLIQWKWWFSSTGYAVHTKWDRKNKRNVKIFLHRLIMNFPEGMEIDHINRNKLDNRKKNLRIVTNQQNHFNTDLRKDNISGYKGIRWRMDFNKWIVYISVDKKQIYLGSYKNLQEAIVARFQGESIYHLI